MKIVYSPGDGDPQVFDISIEDLEGPECELIEESGGNQWVTFGEWLQLLGREGYRATKVLMWALLRRTNPKLTLDDMSGFKVGQLVIFTSDEELEEGKGESGPDDSVTGDAPTSSESPTPDLAP